jgi:hypothetical protein
MPSQSKQDPEVQYGLAWNPRPHLIQRYAVLCAVFSGISIVISWLAVLIIPGGFVGVGALYFASVFYAVITYWFGGWGMLASLIGAIVGSGVLTGMPIFLAIPYGFADVVEPLLPFLLLRILARHSQVDALGGNLLARPWTACLFVIFGAMLPPFLSGLWGTWFLILAGFVPAGAFWAALLSWWLGAAILLAVLVPPICKILSPTLRRTGMACVGIWS